MEAERFFWVAVLGFVFSRTWKRNNREAFSGEGTGKVPIPLLDSNFVQPGLSPHIPPRTLKWVNGPGTPEDAVVIHTDHHLETPSNGRAKIAWLVESPEISPWLYELTPSNLERLRKFDRVITFHKDLLQVLLTAKEGPFGGSHIREEDIKLHPKRKLVSMVASTKDSTSGHKFRNELAQRLEGRVDIFGRGRPLELKNKVDGLADYAFSIAVENSDIPFYYSEKLVDCFLTGTVPVYWGSEETVRKWFDPRGVIFFSTAEDLDKILVHLNMDRYRQMLESVRENFERAKSRHVCPEDSLLAEGFFNV